ncbi:MAG TPA: cyclophane-containing peptide 2OG-Fe(II) oxygenase YhhC [Allosphingosinicella sp.]|jgi:Rps23 Pro-64 3,4-dihydroxylase Tpa1-like proline 4-hydroxylase
MAAATRTDPFPHATAREALPPELVARTLRWMEEEAPWRLRVADFYEQWEMHLEAETIPVDLEDLMAPATALHLADELLPSGRGSVRLVEVTAHRMTEGQTIRVHNDFRPGGETHRILIQLNRGWRDEQGGLLMLFGSGDAGDIRRVIRPVHGSGFGFEISGRSFHAVSTIREGERFTLVYSFREEAGD